MWKKLRERVFGGGAHAEGSAAQTAADADYKAALQKKAEVEALVSRIHAHGVRNHIGERLEAAMRGA